MQRVTHYLRRIRAWISQPRIIYQERIVLADDDDVCANPIFLIGLHRSGTSLMRRVFNAHPEIACPPETFFLQHYARMLRDSYTVAGYKAFGQDEEGMRRHLAAKGAELHEAFRRSQAKRLWADKTPQYVGFLPELQELYPEARFLMIYRHPFDVAYSVDQRGWDLAAQGSEDLFASNLDFMQQQYAKQLAFEKANPQACTRVHYEDVVADPEEELSRVMAAIGEPYYDAMLRHHEGNAGFGTEDPIVRGTKGFKASFGNWMRWPAERISKASKVLGQVAEELGYSIEIADGAKGGRQ